MVEVAFDRERELGEVAVADDLSKLTFGFEHAGGGPAQAHVAGLPALLVAAVLTDGLAQRPRLGGRPLALGISEELPR